MRRRQQVAVSAAAFGRDEPWRAEQLAGRLADPTQALYVAYDRGVPVSSGRLELAPGKAFAGLYGDDMVFKLAGQAHAEALALDGAHLFEPMAGRPMKAWVQVPPTHETQWAELARKAEAALEG